MFWLGYCTSVGTEKQGIFSSQAYQFSKRLYKKYCLARGGVASPTQKLTKVCSCALHRMIVMVPRVQLKHCVDFLASVESMNLLCVPLDTSQNRVSSFALLVPREKHIQSGHRFGSWEKMCSFIPGNQREPDILPTREKRSVR